jgi:hypothetical protein
MVMSRMELEPEKDFAGEAQQQLLSTEPFSRERKRPRKQTSSYLKINKKNGGGPQMPRETGRRAE